MKTYAIALSAGDSVGRELIRQVEKIFSALGRTYGLDFELVPIESCGTAAARYGTAFREKDRAEAERCQAFLLGNMGDGQKISEEKKRPIYTLTSIRQIYQVAVNIRPIRLRPEYADLSPLKNSITEKNMDLLFVRDLMGGMINGRRSTGIGPCGKEASDLEYYNEEIISRIAEFAFREAEKRRGCVTSIDKANVLASGKLWRSKVTEVADRFPNLHLEHDYGDHMAMRLLTEPGSFDVILCGNVYGDILSDEASQISGAPWMFGSAELAWDGRGLYTPNQIRHPRGEELAGKGLVSPYGIINAVSLLLRYSLGREDLAEAVDRAVSGAVAEKLFTGEAVPQGGIQLSCDELGDEIATSIRIIEEKNGELE